MTAGEDEDPRPAPACRPRPASGQSISPANCVLFDKKTGEIGKESVCKVIFDYPRISDIKGLMFHNV